MTTTYLDLIHRGAGYNPERTAIVFGDQSLTFGETQALSNQLAHALIERACNGATGSPCCSTTACTACRWISPA